MASVEDDDEALPILLRLSEPLHQQHPSDADSGYEASPAFFTRAFFDFEPEPSGTDNDVVVIGRQWDGTAVEHDVRAEVATQTWPGDALDTNGGSVPDVVPLAEVQVQQRVRWAQVGAILRRLSDDFSNMVHYDDTPQDSRRPD
ncbi:uncharacterized protein LOC135397105 isoform X5 [Ornithodoros turicata]|uniref:uncharacterized protein LOC135397105 isoform X5 n=1 Tax=Ornithodoros turicata TaxID=34597 RepID=UPI003138659F